MKFRLVSTLLFGVQLTLHLTALGAGGTADRERSFDADWRFLRADAAGAEAPEFADGAWRKLDLPHDWSIEDLPAKGDAAPSPFDPAASEGGSATGYVVGGTGWYRKHFVLPATDAGKKISLRFDGVYMNADVWINGRHLGDHPYGYTPFSYDLTPHLNALGTENVVAVRVRNVGKNSRWYSGSGIYRHVWLVATGPVRIPEWGVHVVTPEVSSSAATVQVATSVENTRDTEVRLRLRSRLIAPDGMTTAPEESEIRIPAGERQEITHVFSVRSPALWSIAAPALYRAEVAVLDGPQVVEHSDTTFGIRSIAFSPATGFLLNGQPVELKGGCMHHDNGPLGAAAIDRAEERRVELMKAYGFNAIRTAHNPPSPAFLDACDRLGVLVIDEAFDMWEKAKNPDDYHLSFQDWWRRDLESMIRRDRNHPSVILWSIGNEIPERAAPSGVALAHEMIALIRPLDRSRPVTAGICEFWDNPNKKWSDTIPAFAPLDVCGYNYQWPRYAEDHAAFPARIMYGSETIAGAVFDAWKVVLEQPWVIGDFVWTAWDYLGETGVGGSVLDNEPSSKDYPWFSAYCGDVDICGFKKAPLYYREVVWDQSKLNLAVRAPVPPGRKEKVSYWGWADERQSWTWPGSEGELLDVTVYSSCASVRLELNGREIAVVPVNEKRIARCQVPYQPGELRAIGLAPDGTSLAHASLRTAGEAKAIRLTADRSTLRADRNDLCYVTVEVVDADGQVVPNGVTSVRFSVTGAGELAATGSGAPKDASSFRLPVRTTYQGRCLAILRPTGTTGSIALKAEADSLKPATLVVTTP